MLSNNSAMYNDKNQTGTSVSPTWTESWNISITHTIDDRTEYLVFLGQVNLAEKTILIILAIFTILGNSLVLVATWRERNLHQPNKYFIACLAIADLLVGTIYEPLKVYYRNLDKELIRSMSIHLCRFIVWIDTFALTASIYSLTFISLDRFFKIRKPLQYQSRMTTSKSLKIIFIICLIAIAFATYAATPHSGSSYGLVCSTVDVNKMKGYYTFLRQQAPEAIELRPLRTR